MFRVSFIEGLVVPMSALEERLCVSQFWEKKKKKSYLGQFQTQNLIKWVTLLYLGQFQTQNLIKWVILSYLGQYQVVVQAI